MQAKAQAWPPDTRYPPPQPPAHLKGVWSWLRSLATGSGPPRCCCCCPWWLPALLAGPDPGPAAAAASGSSASTARESPTLAMCSMRPDSSATQAVVPLRQSSMGASCSWVLAAMSAAERESAGAAGKEGWLHTLVASCATSRGEGGIGRGHAGSGGRKEIAGIAVTFVFRWCGKWHDA